MKIKGYRLFLIFALGIAMIFSLGACKNSKTEEEKKEVVFTFNDKEITLGEVYIYAKVVQQDYVATYGEDVWSMDVTLDDGTTKNMVDITKEDIINNIIEVKILCLKAGSYSVSLTETENADAKNEASDFWIKLTDAQIQEMRLTEELVENVMIENALANKVYKAIMDKANIEVSNEEARETTFYDMYFESYSKDANGNIIELPKEEKKKQYEKALQAYSTLISPIDTENTPNVESLAEYYGLSNSAYYTMSPAEIEKTYGKEVCDSMYKLEDGSYSLVTETQYGYHIFYMKALTDEEATNSNKAAILSKRQREYFEKKFSTWIKETDKEFSYKDSVSQDIYNKIVF